MEFRHVLFEGVERSETAAVDRLLDGRLDLGHAKGQIGGDFVGGGREADGVEPRPAIEMAAAEIVADKEPALGD